MVALREWSGVNQAAFCRAVSMAPNTWNQIEKGVSRPSIENALRIVAVYNVTLDWIYLGNDAGMPHAMAVELARRLS
jgi:DNA-binding XRE family transcriptional regulator